MLALVFLLGLVPSGLYAQDGTLDPTFNAGAGFGGTNLPFGFFIEELPDGKIIVAGRWQTYAGIAVGNGLIRLNNDGSLDPAFNSGGAGISGGALYPTAWDAVIQPDGKIIIAGDFTNYNGTTVNRIARINQDGSLDNSFNTGSGFNGQITDIVLQPDGKIVIVGLFSTFNGSSANRIIRLNPDGTMDNTFNIGTEPNSYVFAVDVQPDGKIVMAGWFLTYNGNSAGRICRLNPDGTFDTTFNPGGTGAPAGVPAARSMKVLPDGKIVYSTSASTYNGTSLPSGGAKFLRLNSDGTIDPSFSIINSVGNYNNGAVVVQPDGKLILAGSYIGGIRRFNADGTIDNTFNNGIAGTNNFAGGASLTSDGKVLLTGQFTTYNGTTANRVCRLYGAPVCSDTDGDGVCDDDDNCPATANADQADADGDGVGDACDDCPNDANKIAPGVCGCGVSDVDSDGDGTEDCNDGCPNDFNKTAPGICGCGVADDDTDGDGTADCNDGCPSDPNKTDPGQCGCGVEDMDSDCDGVADCNDVCPGGDDSVDNNNDGIPDCSQLLNYNDYSADWKCGNNKINICHNGNTLCINKNALPAHFNNHGDAVGPCQSCGGQNLIAPNGSFNGTTSAEVLELELFPNPAKNEVNIHLHGLESEANLTIFDQFGRTVWSQQLAEGQHALNIDLDEVQFMNGIYFVHAVSTDGQRIAQRLVVAK